MKNIIFLIALLSFAVVISSCKKDKDPDFQYKVHIHMPNADDKHIGDTMHVHVDFKSETELPVHHVNVRIYDKDSGTEIYNMPTSAHVHAEGGTHEHHDDVILDSSNGITGHADLILEAKVWGDEAGQGEVMESVEFHVHM